MANPKRLREGLRAGDLRDLVLPLISVDEHESRIGDAIVVAFFLHDQTAASDFNRFVRTSPAGALGTALSPAPDAQGYHRVFVGFRNETRFPQSVMALLRELEGLTGIAPADWAVRLRGVDGTLPIDPTTLRRPVRAAGIVEFLYASDLDAATLETDTLLVQGRGGRLALRVVGFGARARLLAEHRLDSGAVALAPVQRGGHTLSAMLGPGWFVDDIGGVLVVHKDGADALFLTHGGPP